MVSRRRLWHGPVVPGDYRRLLHAVRPHAGLLGLAVASMLVLAAATGAFSWLIGPLFQYVFQGGELKGHGLLPFLSTMDRRTPGSPPPVAIPRIALGRGVGRFR